MALRVNPYPLGPRLMVIGAFRDPAKGESLLGEASRELVALDPGDWTG